MGTHLESWSPPRCLYISIYTNFSHKNWARHTPHVGPARRGRRRWERVETHRNQMLEDVFAQNSFFFLPSTVPAGHTLLIGLFIAPLSLYDPLPIIFSCRRTLELLPTPPIDPRCSAPGIVECVRDHPFAPSTKRLHRRGRPPLPGSPW